VPGRKTDVNDATWLADPLAHGLVRGSFIPDAQTPEMRNRRRLDGGKFRSGTAPASVRSAIAA
jgi:hypothetical protein